MKKLFDVVQDRKENFAEGSYTCYLFDKGLDKILKKCGEECTEMIIAAKNLENARLQKKESLEAEKNDLENEICDLLYHLTVLMIEQGINLEDINKILEERSLKIGNLKKFHETDHNS